MTSAPHTAAVILNWNGLEMTKQCLRSLFLCSYPDLKIILVDNGSQDYEADQLEKIFGHTINLIRLQKNLGFAEGNNIGIRVAIQDGAKYVCLLNNDTTVNPNFLDALVAAAELNNSIAMVAPTMRSMKNPSVIDNLGITLTLSGLSFNRKTEKWRMFCPSGGAVLYRCSALLDVAEGNNFFDPTYFAYVEDLDLGFRLLWRGYRPAYASQAVVSHRGSGSTSPMSDFALYYSQRNLLLTWVKNLPSQHILKYGWLMLIVQFGHALLSMRRRKLNIMLRGDFAAIRLLPQLIQKRNAILQNRKVDFKTIKNLIEPKIVMAAYLRQILRSKK